MSASLLFKNNCDFCEESSFESYRKVAKGWVGGLDFEVSAADVPEGWNYLVRDCMSYSADGYYKTAKATDYLCCPSCYENVNIRNTDDEINGDQPKQANV